MCLILDEYTDIIDKFAEIRRFNPFHPNKIRFGIWYELYDGDSDSYPVDIEAHFGIMHTDGSPKLAYDDLKRLLH